MYCKNCGKELPPQAKFCLDCGTPAPTAENASPEKVSLEAEKTPVAEQTVSAAVFTAAPVLSGKKRGGVIVALGAVALITVIGVVALISLFGGKGPNAHYVYVTSDNELMYLESLKEGITGIEFSDEGDEDSCVVFSKDGKYLYFIEPEDTSYGPTLGTLYCLDIASLEKEGTPVKISSDVEPYSLSLLDNGHLLYEKSRSGKTQVWVYTGEDSYKLVSDIFNWLGTNDDQTYGYYQESFDSYRNLCRVELKPDGKTETLIKEYDILFTDYDQDVLLYGKSELTEGYDYIYTIYSIVPGESKEKLLSDVCSVLDYYSDGVTEKDGKFSFYYTVCETEERSFYDFVTDKLAESDSNAPKEKPVYPDYSNDYYPRYGIYTDDVGSYYETYSGKRYYLDYSSYPNMGDVDIAYQMADDLFDKDKAEYDVIYDQWMSASNRDSLREELKSQIYNITTYSLYYFNGETSIEIANNLSDGYPGGMAAANVFFYNKVPDIEGTLAEVSELEGSYELSSMIYEALSVDNSVYYQNVNGVEKEFELEADEYGYVSDTILLGDNELIVVLNEDEDIRLCSYIVEGTTLTFNKEITDEPFSSLHRDLHSSGKPNAIYYYMDVSDDNMEGDLYCYSNGETTRVLSEVYNMIVVDGGDMRYALSEREYDENNRISYYSCNLSIVDEDEKLHSIGSDVRSDAIWFLDNQYVMYIQEDDLYCWDGESSRRVATDVLYFWTNSSTSRFNYQLLYW